LAAQGFVGRLLLDRPIGSPSRRGSLAREADDDPQRDERGHGDADPRRRETGDPQPGQGDGRLTGRGGRFEPRIIPGFTGCRARRRLGGMAGW